MSKSIKFKNDIYWDTSSITHNQENLKTLLSGLKIKCDSISGLSLDAGATYQLTLPETTIFVEPLLEAYGTNYSGGSFISPGGAFCCLTNTDYTPDGNKGIYISCNSNGLVTISTYRHCGALVKGFRVWYLNI